MFSHLRGGQGAVSGWLGIEGVTGQQVGPSPPADGAGPTGGMKEASGGLWGSLSFFSPFPASLSSSFLL